MTEAIPGPQTPRERQVVRQLGVAAEALVLYSRMGEPGHEERVREFERAHRPQDLLEGLLVVADTLGRTGYSDEQYFQILAGWQLAAEVVDAMAAVAEEFERPGTGGS